MIDYLSDSLYNHGCKITDPNINKKYFKDLKSLSYIRLAKTLVKAVHISIGDVRTVQEEFGGLVSTSSKGPWSFTLPDGFVVKTSYKVKQELTITVVGGGVELGGGVGQKVRCESRFPTGTHNHSRVITARFVNLIHSCDAYHMYLMVTSSLVPFLPIHDSLLFPVND